jgi:hypothetical protein
MQRTDAASGRTASGAALAEATTYGQNMASTEYINQFNRISHLAGADVGSPAAAGQILQQAGQTQQAGATAFGGAIGQAVGGQVANWFTPSSVSNNNPTYTPAQMTAMNTPSSQAVGGWW